MCDLLKISIHYTIRKVIPATWLNDRDQFLFPTDGWQTDTEFQNDCLAYALFHGQNRITSSEDSNHWIPFTEYEVNAQAKFESSFMSDFIKGKIRSSFNAPHTNLFSMPSPSLRGSGGVQSRKPLHPLLTQEYLEKNKIPTQSLIFSELFLPYNPNLKEKSRALRKGYILAETILWKQLRADTFMGHSFNRQKPILNYITDFYCKALNLVVEIDGSSHDTEEAILYDKERDRQMQVLGLHILRVRDAEVRNNLANVLDEIKQFIEDVCAKEKGKFTPPAPLKEGEMTPPSPLKEGELLRAGSALVFSAEAQAVFDAGRELWKYYHAQKDVNVNASLYDIREHFQGRNDKGRMNAKSDEARYMSLIGELRSNLSILAEKIQPKVYEYGFLKE